MYMGKGKRKRLLAGVLCSTLITTSGGWIAKPISVYAGVEKGISEIVQYESSNQIVTNGGFESKSVSDQSDSHEYLFWKNHEYATDWGIWYSKDDAGDLHDPANAQFTFDTEDRQEGNQSLHFSSTAPTKLLLSCPAKDIQENKSYLLTAKVKVSGVKEGYFTIKVKDSTGKTVECPRINKSTDGWIDMVYSFKPGELSKSASVQLDFNKITGNVWVDDISMIESYSMSMVDTSLKIKPGESQKLELKFEPEEAEKTAEVTWSSSDSSEVSVDGQGNIEALKAGYAQITAVTDMGISAKCNVEVISDELSSQFQSMRESWKARLCIGSDNEQYQKTFLNIKENALEYQDSMSTGELNGNGQDVWPDLDFSRGEGGITGTAYANQISTAFDRLRMMALAYSIESCGECYQNPDLFQAIIRGLEGMCQYYNSKNPPLGNWYEFDIGGPRSLSETLILLYDDLNKTEEGKKLIDTCVESMRYYIPTPERGMTTYGDTPQMVMTGANLMDTSFVCCLRGIISESVTDVSNASNAAVTVFPYVTTGDGFYKDGSYIQHGCIPYAGGYGPDLIAAVEKLIYLLNDSQYTLVGKGEFENMTNWMLNSYLPLFRDGEIMDMVRGRKISRDNDTGHSVGRSVLATLTLLSDYVMDEGDQYTIKSMIKGNFERDTVCQDDIYRGMDIYRKEKVKSLMEDPDIEASQTEESIKTYGSMDRVVEHRQDYSVGLSMFSSRVGRFTYGNGENTKGYHLGDGMVYLYTDDILQYEDGFWPTVDFMRLPGITTDHTAGHVEDWKPYRNTKDWVGGSNVAGKYGSVGMDVELEPEYSNLTGKKSWFLFDDEVICLGAGITGTTGTSPETIVENRRTDESPVVCVNGETIDLEEGVDKTLSAQWAVLHANDSTMPIGYYFPEETEVSLLKESRTGKWSDINNNGSKEKITRNYVSIAVPHGEKPENASYNYVILPGKDEAAVKEYAESKSTMILSNTDKIQAVADTESGLTGYNFWEAGTVDGVEAKQACSVTKQSAKGQNGETVLLGISDPTQKQEHLTIVLDGIYECKTVEPGIFVSADQANKKTIIEVQVKDTYGSSQHVELNRVMSRVEIENGQIIQVGEDEYESNLEWVEPGTVVKIRADEAEDGHEFLKWETVPSTVKLDDADAVETSFVVPEGSVKIRATYMDFATPSNAAVSVKVMPEDWYAYAESDSLDELLADDEIIIPEDREFLKNGGDITVELQMTRKSDRYTATPADAIRENLEEDEKIAFFVKTALSKTLQENDSAYQKEVSLATASNAVKMTFEITDQEDGCENYRIVGWNPDLEDIDECDFEWLEEGKIITFTGKVNGVYALTYTEKEEPKEPETPEIPNESEEDDDTITITDPKILLTQVPLYAAAGTWEQQDGQWIFILEDSGDKAIGWIYAEWNGNYSWYHFDQNGYMQSGWYYDTDGNWYYMNPVSDGTKGKMYTGWHQIDGNWYYFNETSDGTRGAWKEV